jgi:hypothetical protein
MSKPLTLKTTDHSDEGGFSFGFFCDTCGKEWRSPFVRFDPGFTSVEHEETRKLIWAEEHRIAFEHANLEAQMHFNLCKRCGKWVCETCFDTEGEEVWWCRECKANEK